MKQDFPTVKHRIGIASGKVFLGVAGGARFREFTVHGGIVNLAARLLGQAEEDHIVLSPHTAQELQRSFYLQELKPIKLKGIEDAITPSVIESRRAVQYRPIQDRPFVGRKQELEFLENALFKAHNDKVCTTLMLVGEAGIGKSRLLEVISEHAKAQDFLVLSGECEDYSRSVAYMPWRPILKLMLGLSPNDGKETILSRLTEVLDTLGETQMLPLMAEAIGITIDDNEITKGMDPDSVRFKIAALVEGILTQRMTETPLLLILDDLQWVDEASVFLLRYLVRNISEQQLVFILAARPSETTDEIIESISPQRVFRLEPLAALDIEEMLRRTLQIASITPQLLELVEERTMGNSLFVEEVLQYLSQKELIKVEGDSAGLIEDVSAEMIPEKVSQVILSRVDNLDEKSRAILRIASVVGRHFNRKMLVKVHDTTTDDELDTYLAGFEELDVVHKIGGSPGDYIFKHIVSQEVAYSTLSYSARRHYHERVAVELEQGVLGEADAQLEQIYHHYSHTAETRQAYEYAEKCAARAEKARNPRSSVHYLELAEKHLEELRAQGSIEDEQFKREMISLLTNHLQLLDMMSDYEKYIPLVKEMRILAEEIGDARSVLMAIGKEGDYYSMIGKLDESLELNLKATVGAELANYLQLEVAMLVQTSITLWRMGRLDDAQKKLDRAEELAKQEGLLDEISYVQATSGMLQFGKGDYVKAEELYTMALERSREVGNYDRELVMLANIGGCRSNLGDIDGARTYFQQMYDDACKYGLLRSEMIAAIGLGETILQKCKWAEACRYLTEALKIAEKLEETQGIYTSTIALADVLVMCGDFDGARELIDRAQTINEMLNNPSVAAFILYREMQLEGAQGNWDKAWEHIEEAHSIAEQTQIPQLLHMCKEGCAEVLINLGKLHDAEQLLEQLAADDADNDLIFVDYAELELARKNPTAALSWLDRIKPTAPVLTKPQYLLAHYQALYMAGRQEDAVSVLKTAMQMLMENYRNLPEEQRQHFWDNPDNANLRAAAIESSTT